MDPTAFRSALGLPETATEAEILARVTANAASASAHAQAVTAIAAAAGVAATDQAGLIAALQTQRAAGGDAELSRTVVALQTQLQTLQQGAARARAEAFIDGAIRAGNPIVPLRDRLIARHMVSAADVEAEVDALPSIHPGGIVVAAHTGGAATAHGLTAAEAQMARVMGKTPAEYAKAKAALRDEQGDA